ncbi:hypothetical protein [Paraburkholderia sp. UYCP14C]|uniref:hypothetical protein n=1 Tax=Paraburkholderia sp. UYCP14C TaxID=2511130 RepID=UPI0020070DC7|nr:hypothetical protein [Paraburkholderia sp. UYCP14C]
MSLEHTGRRHMRARKSRREILKLHGYAPAAYDATWVLINAMKKANSTDPKVYGPFIKSVAFVGISGDIAFMPNGDMKDPAATFYKVIDGKWVPQAVAYGEKVSPLQN